MLLSFQPLVLLSKGKYKSNSKEKKVISMQERRLSDIDVGLFELSVLILK